MDSRHPEETPPGLFPVEEVVPTVPENRETDLSSAEQTGHLIEALNYYDSLATTENLIRRFYNDKPWLDAQVEAKGQTGVYIWRRKTHEKHPELAEKAEQEFRQAYPPAMLEAEGLTAEEAEAEIARRYKNFHDAYRGSSQARVRKRQEVREEYQRFLGADQVEAALAEEQAIVEAVDFPPENPDAKVSLARALRSEFSQLDPRDYKDIPPDVINTYHPGFFTSALTKVVAGTPNALWCRPDQDSGNARIYTVFLPGEWGTILRSRPKYIADVAYNVSEVAQRKLPPEERDPEASHNARIAVNLSKAEAMQAYIDQNLDVSLDVIARFKEAAQFNGGLARFGNEANMREQLDYFWKTIVGDMIWAARIVSDPEEGWDYEKEEEILHALEKAVHFAPSPAERLHRFVLLNNAAETFIIARKQHILTVKAEAEYYADEQRDKRRRIRVAKQIPELLA